MNKHINKCSPEHKDLKIEKNSVRNVLVDFISKSLISNDVTVILQRSNDDVWVCVYVSVCVCVCVFKIFVRVSCWLLNWVFAEQSAGFVSFHSVREASIYAALMYRLRAAYLLNISATCVK